VYLNFLTAAREAIEKSHGPIYRSDFIGVVYLDVSARGITSLAGLEHFWDLIELDVSQNRFDYIDISNNQALEVLIARNMGLTALDVSNNRALRVLDISRNRVSELNLYYNRALESIRAEWNSLSSLDISMHTRMHTLYLAVNELEELHVWDLRTFENFNVISNPIANDFPIISGWKRVWPSQEESRSKGSQLQL